ncbi:uncharacterized protein LY79DRAFT_577009 [Colletotrichum navitas]|uniref:Uncharacterized protein n=1 Tax=Colletotrichum navitas TaxID=681940 RepID=A0AAD8Q6T5_9PEZI|nr:uncharacterized protein LY79DRAFT_577009 [Colletotrichum navitas]KAK1596842.1 hypothetical protein LY79DRAFT_577009 [Colletotrichum navitas]
MSPEADFLVWRAVARPGSFAPIFERRSRSLPQSALACHPQRLVFGRALKQCSLESFLQRSRQGATCTGLAVAQYRSDIWRARLDDFHHLPKLAAQCQSGQSMIGGNWQRAEIVLVYIGSYGKDLVGGLLQGGWGNDAVALRHSTQCFRRSWDVSKTSPQSGDGQGELRNRVRYAAVPFSPSRVVRWMQFETTVVRQANAGREFGAKERILDEDMFDGQTGLSGQAVTSVRKTTYMPTCVEVCTQPMSGRGEKTSRGKLQMVDDGVVERKATTPGELVRMLEAGGAEIGCLAMFGRVLVFRETFPVPARPVLLCLNWGEERFDEVGDGAVEVTRGLD